MPQPILGEGILPSSDHEHDLYAQPHQLETLCASLEVIALVVADINRSGISRLAKVPASVNNALMPEIKLRPKLEVIRTVL